MFFAVLLAAASTTPAAIPINNPADWASSGDYPKEALIARVDGTVAFRVTVGPDGQPLSCAVIQSSKNTALDSKTCELVMARAKFKPTQNKGQRISGAYQNSIRWVLPPTVTLEAEGALGTANISAAGEILGCTDSVIGDIKNDAKLCDIIHKEFVETYLADSLEAYEQVTVRLLKSPAAVPPLESGPYLENDEHVVIASATFQVPASGLPRDCVAQKAVYRGRTLDICKFLIEGGERFEPDPQRMAPVEMRIELDLGAKKRMAN